MLTLPMVIMLTIVALGDSTTAGTPGFFSPRERPPEGLGNPESQYSYWVAQKHPEWKILNRGVRGQRSDQILKRFEWDVFSNNPQVLIVLGGVNDLYQGYPVEHVKQNLTQIYDRAEAAGIKIMACTILPVDLASEEVKQRIREANAWIKENAVKRGFGFCDTYTALENPSRPGFLTATPDDVHPDVSGYKKMGEVIAAALETWLPGTSLAQPAS